MSSTDCTPIRVSGSRVHNLQNLTVEFPRGKWTSVTGVSGAGKSSLVFDTIHAEGQRRYIETLSPSTRVYLNPLERPDVDRIDGLPPTVAVGAGRQAVPGSNTVAETIELLEDLGLFATHVGQTYCPCCQIPVAPQHVPLLVAELQGLPEQTRYQITFPLPLLKSATEQNKQREEWESRGFHRFQPVPEAVRSAVAGLSRVAELVILDRLQTGKVDEERLTESLEQAYALGEQRCVVLVDAAELNAADSTAVVEDERGRPWETRTYSANRQCPQCQLLLPEVEATLFRRYSAVGACETCRGTGETGTAANTEICDSCHGLGLNAVARNIRFPTVQDDEEPRSLEALLALSAAEFARAVSAWTEHYARHSESLSELLGRLAGHLQSLTDLGLKSLRMDRRQQSLPVGEAGRVLLSAATSSPLVDALYLVDEPTRGLHPCDCPAIGQQLRRLLEFGNTVIVIEHQPELVHQSDHVIHIGPGSGREGGTVVYEGDPAGLVDFEKSTTAISSGMVEAEDLPVGRPVDGKTQWIQLDEASCRNVQKVSLRIPAQHFSVVSGVCGAGKTSLVSETFIPAVLSCLPEQEDTEASPFAGAWKEISGVEGIDDVVLATSTEATASRRSTPVTYLKVYDEIRKLFASSADAKAKGYTATRFSFNSARGGRCERCEGAGTIEIDLQLLPSMLSECPVCAGRRFDSDTLSVQFRNRNIADVLAMTVDDAFGFFRNQPKVQRRLQPLKEVGLGYISLGTPTAQLSQGELQRLKLASFLLASTGKHVLYVFDEPAGSLHPADVVTLLRCFLRLVEQGHTVVAVDHHWLLLEAADWIVDLGPGAAEDGGEVLHAGTLEELLKNKRSLTAQYLNRRRA
ncbi:MAG: hypothetical protein CMJ47_03005 [Planctomyces sp.]|nr:hypothetical protein [Planctomyces sp.]